MKLKLTGKQFVHFTGQLGCINWVDGVSETDVSPLEANRIASLVGAKFLDGSDASECDKILSMKNMESPYRQESRPLTVEEIARMEKERKKKPLNKPKKKIENVEIEYERKYSREELEAIADKKGITGLREIAAQYGVTAVSISTMIEKIIDSQENPPKPIPHYEDEENIKD